MPPSIILASASSTRLSLLQKAGVPVSAHPARIDEGAVRGSMTAEGAPSRDIADRLAEMKALKVANRHPDAVVIGADQVLEFDGCCLGKPATAEDARAMLLALRGNRHSLRSAVVLVHEGAVQWRHVGSATLTMRNFSDAWLDAYIASNLDRIRHSAGGYQVEEEGVRLFSAIEGDWFTILGLPLLPLLLYLGQRGMIET